MGLPVGSTVPTVVQSILVTDLIVPDVRTLWTAGAAVGHLGCALQGTVRKFIGGLSAPCTIHQSQFKLADTPSLNPLVG